MSKKEIAFTVLNISVMILYFVYTFINLVVLSNIDCNSLKFEYHAEHGYRKIVKVNLNKEITPFKK